MIFKIDDFITTQITKFVWWVDLNFNKDTVWLIKITTVFITPLLSLVFDYFVNNYSVTLSSLINCVAALITLMVIMFLAEKYIAEVKALFENTRNSPNKNRGNYNIGIFKISSLIMYVVFETNTIKSVFRAEGTYTNSALTVAILLSLYLLCAEPLPPAVRRKKLEEKSLRTLEHQLQASRQYK